MIVCTVWSHVDFCFKRIQMGLILWDKNRGEGFGITEAYAVGTQDLCSLEPI